MNHATPRNSISDRIRSKKSPGIRKEMATEPGVITISNSHFQECCLIERALIIRYINGLQTRTVIKMIFPQCVVEVGAGPGKTASGAF